MLIGIDLGTTALKVAAFDTRSGKRLAGISKRLRVELAPDGRREQSPAALQRALKHALAELRNTLGTKRRIRGLGIAAQGGSTIIVDRRSGKALTPMILWNDSRAFPEYQALIDEKPPRYWRQFSLRDEPGMGLARIRYMQQHTPELLSDENLYVGAGEFLYFQLTGQWRQDAGNALQIGCYDARQHQLTARPLNLIDTPLSFFAPMRNGHETHPLSDTAAKRLGLPSGIPVAGPYMDHEAGYLSSAQVSKNPLQCSLGTAWVGNFCLPDSTKGHSPFQLVAPAPAGSGRLVIQPLLTGNVTWDWALSNFVDANHQRALKKQATIFAKSLLPPKGMIALPWLNRPNPFSPDHLGGAAYLGTGPHCTQADYLRATAAGMCYELARIVAEAKARRIFDSVVLSGGASKGTHFQQILATLFAPLPVYLNTEEEGGGARGCLHAFGLNTPKTLLKALRCGTPKVTSDIQQGQRLYNQVFSKLYGHIAAGKAYSFPRQREKRT